MTKKDYELIANTVKEVKRLYASKSDSPILTILMFELARELKKENPKFDKQKFANACGLQL